MQGMDESTLLKTALCVSIAGIVLLSIALQTFELEESSLSKAKAAEEGAAVRVHGTVQAVTVKGNLTLATLSRVEELLVVAFSNVSLQPGDDVIVEGRMQAYNNEPELVADMIEKAQ